MCPHPIHRHTLSWPRKKSIPHDLVIQFDLTEIAGEVYETFQLNNGPVWLAQNLRNDENGNRVILPFRRGGSCVSHPNGSYAEIYGRYYTFETAVAFARQYGGDFRLPTAKDWNQLLTTLRACYRPEKKGSDPALDFFLRNTFGRRIAMHWGGCRWPGSLAYWGRGWQGVYWSAEARGLYARCYVFANDRQQAGPVKRYRWNSYAVRLVKPG